MNDFSKKMSFDYAQIGDVRLHFATAGTGERLVILLHGFPEFWYSWRHQIEVLSRDFTVVAPDLRGYNLSSKPSRIADFEMEHLVDDVTGLIRHFGREQAALVGHDWGAAVAWATAQKHPEYVSKLAALQVPPMSVWRKNLTFKQILTSWYMLFLQIPRLPEWLLSRNNFALLKRALVNSTARGDVFTPEDLAEYEKSWNEAGAINSAVNYYRANFSKFFTQPHVAEQRIKVPTLFIFGERDHAIVSETVRGVEQFIDAQYSELRIPNAAHWVQQEAAEEVSAALLKFLND